jgi:hypothetical protein
MKSQLLARTNLLQNCKYGHIRLDEWNWMGKLVPFSHNMQWRKTDGTSMQLGTQIRFRSIGGNQMSIK